MARKTIAWGVPIFLFKYIKTEHNYSECIELKHRNVFPVVNISGEVAMKWLKDKKTPKEPINISAFGNSYRKCYAYMRFLEAEFWGKFISYVQGAVDNGLFAKDAMCLFLDRYEIGEQDLKMETCKKRWVRREQRLEKKSIEYR
jgi:hypothetical protein